MVFYDNLKKIYASSPPPSPLPPPRRRTFRRIFQEKFFRSSKKNIVQRNVAEKKILASNWGMKKNSCTEKLPNPPPPLKYLMVRPLTAPVISQICQLLQLILILRFYFS